MKRPLVLFLLAPLVLVTWVVIGLHQTKLITVGEGPDLAALLPWGAAKISFNQDVQPILSANCYLCHGPDSGSRKANLRLDRKDFAFQPRDNGKPTIIPGHPEQSEVYRRITSTDPAEIMPPPASHHVLKPEEIAVLKNWIRQGAVYQEHWSYLKPIRPAVPSVSWFQWSWPKNPIDHFVLAKLEQNKLEPQPEADRRSLIRRVTLDLTGLPPTPEDVAAFVHDRSPQAYEKVVDRLLADPHYGEHAAHYWLDAARYGDTHGIHVDNYRSIWLYRDWVINALNQNMPFDQFTREQLAGDLLPDATIEQKIASGFNRCAPSTGEGGSIPEEVLAMYAKDRVDTTSAVFLGQTMGCAACHDHKFDPISQKDFYSMSAFFRNTTQPALDGNREDALPFLRVPARKDRERWKMLPVEIADAQKPIEAKIAAIRPKLDRLESETNWSPKPVSDSKLEFSLPLRVGSGLPIQTLDGRTTKLSDTLKWVEGAAGKAVQFSGKAGLEFPGVGDFDTTDAFSATLWINPADKASGVFLCHLDTDNDRRGWDLALEKNSVALMFNSGPQKTVKVITDTDLTLNTWQCVGISYDGSGKADGVKIYFNGVLQSVKAETPVIDGSILCHAPLQIGRRSPQGSFLEKTSLQDIRLYRRALTPEEMLRMTEDERILALRATGDSSKWTQVQRDAFLSIYLVQTDPSYQGLVETRKRLVQEQEAIRQRSPVTLVMEEKPEKPFAHILKRGQYDQLGEKVFPGVPAIFPPLPADQPKNRLGLAQWLTGPDHPLLARVTVNRYWQQFFGVGLVKTSEDFGVMGERPVNQPLLDWLAVEFRESGWDVKHLQKLMVMSAAYRQSARITPEALEKDPENRLVSRGPRYRMDAEVIRDQALAASDLLTDQIGGPSVKPYQPPGVWEAVAMTQSNTRFYKQDKGDALYRRSLYVFWKRSAPHPSLDTFNAPTRETCVVRRERTNTPMQALVTMNDPQFVEAARHLAVKAIQAGGSNESARLDYLAQRLLARPLHADEEKILLKGAKNFLATYQAKPTAAEALLQVGDSAVSPEVPKPEQAAWTMVASQFLNLDETLNK